MNVSVKLLDIVQAGGRAQNFLRSARHETNSVGVILQKNALSKWISRLNSITSNLAAWNRLCPLVYLRNLQSCGYSSSSRVNRELHCLHRASLSNREHRSRVGKLFQARDQHEYRRQDWLRAPDHWLPLDRLYQRISVDVPHSIGNGSSVLHVVLRFCYCLEQRWMNSWQSSELCMPRWSQERACNPTSTCDGEPVFHVDTLLWSLDLVANESHRIVVLFRGNANLSWADLRDREANWPA